MRKFAKAIVRQNRIRTVFFLLITLLFLFCISIAIAPLHKIKAYKNIVNSDTLFVEKFDSIYYNREMNPFVKEKTYKNALLKLSEKDSIQLVVNLSDSLVSLSIKGVIIHQSKISAFNTDMLLKKIPFIQEVKLFSEPLSIHTQYATIVKEPVVVRHAPKDTIEAALNAWQPDTLVQNPAFVLFELEYGIQLIFEQDKNLTFYDKRVKFNFYNNLRLRQAKAEVTNFVRLNQQEYHPKITVKINVDDLRAIYRALPKNSFVVLNI
jgi:hypothetical protein